ncbi:MAG: alkaline phosphatase D family protein [Bryobacterales bacterium]|nr:alkaline phosphatase D family protein [Bryobacterales bacterium]
MTFANRNRDLLERRRFLIQSGAFLGLTFAAGSTLSCASPKFGTNPFTLGVASGDPLPDGVVLWTRLAPKPSEGGGMPPEDVEVRWQVASDDKMANIVQQGKATAPANLAHAVHVEVDGLEPGRWYFYRFIAGSEESPIGRTRTAAAANHDLDRLSFAFASCQHYEYLYTSFQHMADEDLDLVIHLGDYIYEGGPRPDPSRPRDHGTPQIVSLSDYRNRYALYRSDPLLREVHARFPWVVTWDDHEVDNNYANDIPEDDQPREAFLERRANAYQAYYEHLPLRRTSLPTGSKMLLYRRLAYGNLAEFSVLDTRQYRTDQPCDDGTKPPCPAMLDPNATMMGPEQEQWLVDGLNRSTACWNVLAQQVMMAKVDRMPGPDVAHPMDQWAGYEVARNRLLAYLGERRIANPVVLTGDIHSNWVADLHVDFSNPKSLKVGTEFVATSISSSGDGSDTVPTVAAYLPENPHVKFFNSQRGYVRCVVTPDQWRSDYRVVEYVTKPGSPIATRASFVVENGRPGAVPA